MKSVCNPSKEDYAYLQFQMTGQLDLVICTEHIRHSDQGHLVHIPKICIHFNIYTLNRRGRVPD